MALLGTQQFTPVIKPDGSKATEVTDLVSPSDLEEFVADFKGLLEGTGVMIEQDARVAALHSECEVQEGDDEVTQKAKAMLASLLEKHDVKARLTDGQKAISWMVTGQYIQDTKRDGTQLVDRNDAPYAFWKHRCFRERNDDGQFNPMTMGTFRIRETNRGSVLANDPPLNYGGREVKGGKGSGKKGGKGKKS
ncbi:MAG: hypothetical protein GTO63_08015 [Anaerolineae bacterium]|nr:hypothetical protein [Anaerolineae bacterium]NIN94875.1 hypothetical protein [Anaerolineae bacterium]NIQ77926.1 hypothetical protein [Anaerolineae bacterium]